MKMKIIIKFKNISIMIKKQILGYNIHKERNIKKVQVMMREMMKIKKIQNL
jgi:hypothetical protein